jgi:hypothetical protein
MMDSCGELVSNLSREEDYIGYGVKASLKKNIDNTSW